MTGAGPLTERAPGTGADRMGSSGRAGGEAPTRRERPYQRRRRGPVLVMIAILAAAAVSTWAVVLTNVAGRAGMTTCPPPVAGPPPGELLDRDALDGVAPLPPPAVLVRVLNAGGQRGQANLVKAQLGDRSFGSAGLPDNDPFYPDGEMECFGQVRFGPAGEAAASTVTVVLPCLQLVRDERADATVDVSVGTAFGDLEPGRAARTVLEQLAGGDPANPPAVDPALIAEARDVSC